MVSLIPRAVHVVEGLNVINDPKCNKVLNVITFVLNVITFVLNVIVLNVIPICPKCIKLSKLPITVITRISAALK